MGGNIKHDDLAAKDASRMAEFPVPGIRARRHRMEIPVATILLL
jgi:hypothetical protein